MSERSAPPELFMKHPAWRLGPLAVALCLTTAKRNAK